MQPVFQSLDSKFVLPAAVQEVRPFHSHTHTQFPVCQIRAPSCRCYTLAYRTDVVPFGALILTSDDSQVRGHTGHLLVGHCDLSGGKNLNLSRQAEEDRRRRSLEKNPSHLRTRPVILFIHTWRRNLIRVLCSLHPRSFCLWWMQAADRLHGGGCMRAYSCW